MRSHDDGHIFRDVISRLFLRITHPQPPFADKGRTMKGSSLMWLFRLKELGWAGMLGLGLLLGCGILSVAVLLPELRHLDELERDIAQLHSGTDKNQGQWVDRSPHATLNTFYRFLPAESDAPAQVSSIFSAANDNGIDLDKIEYTLTHDPAAGFSRYQVILPLSGTYPDIRHFVIDLLNTMPALAINELSFKREDTHSQEVEARLRLTIYLGRPS